MKNKNTVAIVQARMGSTRFPNKVMQLINGLPLIELLLDRLSRSQEIDLIVLATSDKLNNKPLVEHVKKIGYSVFQGNEDDVLDRYYQAAVEFKATEIVRITGDCPLIDWEIVDQVIELFHHEKADYATNTDPPTYPDGLDVSVCTFESLKTAWKQAEIKFDREHVMPFIRKSNFFKKVNLSSTVDYSQERWTVDEPEDLDVIKNIVKYFSIHRYFSWKEVIKLHKTMPEIFLSNKDLRRNEGSISGTGQKLWKRAKRVIPGGNMLLSKRPEMFLPDLWPSYYSKSKGCNVWDMDGNKLIDMSIMGIGTNILGYGHPEVDTAVKKVIKNGNMSTLNCPEEVYLAERLIDMHPWADMARFARSGGEANSIAIRIARAASGKDDIAICGYHGWHDWYLSANLKDGSSLNKHLLSGLKTTGVPKVLTNTVHPFSYNNFEELESLVEKYEIGVIKMEVKRNIEPSDNFLEKVRELSNKNNIVLIFDECTSGFRETFGGLHKKYNVDPDMAIFGKALGNGYAITAVIGTREVMDAAQSTFISSTFWTERIGPVAALATLNAMEKEKSWEKITDQGKKIGKLWEELAVENNLKINVFGLPSLIKFSLDCTNFLAYKTLITQEMLKSGYLASNSLYVCTKHTDEVISLYAEKLNDVFKIIEECEDGRDIGTILKTPVCHSEFKRLN
jgi:glutamate-1-semialdehyde 2,1-aminomutase